jgi:hypothetical protein
MRKFRIVMAIALTGFVAGCGAEKGAGTGVPVSGKVTLDKEPLAGARVVFVPTKSTVGNSAQAFTDASGEYKLGGGPGAGGVTAGEYKVVVSRLLLKDGSPAPPDTPAEVFVRESLPLQYSNRDSTTLTAIVPAGGATLDFALKKTGK